MSPMESTREDNVYMAKLSEQAERYEGDSILLCSILFDGLIHCRNGGVYEGSGCSWNGAFC